MRLNQRMVGTALVLIPALAIVAQAAPLGTAFTYQGQLEDGVGPITDSCDFQFTLWTADVGGTQVDGVAPVGGVSLVDGMFTVVLDFGPGSFIGEARWLDISVCCPAAACALEPLTPRVELTPAPHALALPGLYTEQDPTSPNIVGGHETNAIEPGTYGATVSGGGAAGSANQVLDYHGTIGGGRGNQAGSNDGNPNSAREATVAGGFNNTAINGASTVSGGRDNTAGGVHSAIGGGIANAATGDNATVAGGETNTASGQTGVVAGGRLNTASGTRSSIGGGEANSASQDHATVAGGMSNIASGIRSAVGGGESNVAGGTNTTVAGGLQNTASGSYAAVAGGWGNNATGAYGNVNGGLANSAAALYTTAGGGYNNQATAQYATVGGGETNIASQDHTTIAGGMSNIASGIRSNVGGGESNTAGGGVSSVGGGLENAATGYASSVAGGRLNVAGGEYAIVAGGVANQAGGSYSLAAGRNAKVRDAATSLDADGDEGTFVWADSDLADFESTGPNQFLIRAAGGVGINTNAPTSALTIGGTPGVDGLEFPDGTLQTTAAAGGADNLGDHTATTTLNMNSQNITGVNNLTANGTINSGSSITIDGTAGSERIASSASLDFETATGRALRLEDNATSPNLIGGYSGNSVTVGVGGATVAGGGGSAVGSYLCDYPYFSSCGICVGGENDGATCSSNLSCLGGICQPNSGACPGGATCDLREQLTCDGGGNAGAPCGRCTVNGSLCSLDMNCGPNGPCVPNQGDCASPGVCSPRIVSNSVTGHFGAISGGVGNVAGSGSAATVGGGYSNAASAYAATVGGGAVNQAIGDYSTIGGGYFNEASGVAATVAGGGSTSGSGTRNVASGDASAIGGGYGNLTPGTASTVPGGYSNIAEGDFSYAAGHNAKAFHVGAFVWADYSTLSFFNSTASNQFLIRAAGGVGIGTTDPAEALDVNGNIHASGTIASGSSITIDGTAGSEKISSTDNLELYVGASGRAWRFESGSADSHTPNVIGGGGGNSVAAGVLGATIGGGGGTPTEYPGHFNSVSGGYGTIGGGQANGAGGYGTVGGGNSNYASGDHSTVSGGWQNSATAESATVAGGRGNLAAGAHSLAAGYRAQANHDGAFVWGDSTFSDVASERTDQFRVRANGGARFDDDARWVNIYDDGTDLITTSTGAHLTIAGVWTDSSDRNRKEDLTRVDPREVLQRLSTLPVNTWRFKVENPSVRHMGAMAQDFYATFGLGNDDRHIAALDTGGVALAAIQGLYEIVKDKDRQIEELQAKTATVEELEAKVSAMEAVMHKLLASQSGGAQ